MSMYQETRRVFEPILVCFARLAWHGGLGLRGSSIGSSGFSTRTPVDGLNQIPDRGWIVYCLAIVVKEWSWAREGGYVLGVFRWLRNVNV